MQLWCVRVSGLVTRRPAFPYNRVYLVNIASVCLTQDVILRLLVFLSEGLQLLAEALPPENLGAGETAEEWGEVVIYPVETIRKRSAPSAARQPSTPPRSSPTFPVPPPHRRWPGGSLDSSLLRVPNPLLHVFHCRLNKAQAQLCFLLVSLLLPKRIQFTLDVITQEGVKGTR